MITIITRWEESQMPSQVEWQLWRQLRGAFKITKIVFTPVIEEMKIHKVDQYDTMADCIWNNEGAGELVFLEPTGYNPVGDIPQGDIVMVLGNTDHDNMKYAKVNETYKIASPQRTALYPTEAAAIALAIRYGQ